MDSILIDPKFVELIFMILFRRICSAVIKLYVNVIKAAFYWHYLLPEGRIYIQRKKEMKNRVSMGISGKCLLQLSTYLK